MTVRRTNDQTDEDHLERPDGEFIKFPVSAMAVFEKGNQDVMDRTII
jgi:hypothetical protein